MATRNSSEEKTSASYSPLAPVTEEFEQELQLLTGGGETDTVVTFDNTTVDDAEDKTQ